MTLRIFLSVLFAAAAARADDLSTLGRFDDIPVGIAASGDGRVFLAFSRAIDPGVTMSVAELVGYKPVPFPDGFKQNDGQPAPDRLLSVQAITVDGKNRLWILDCGKVGSNSVDPGAPKLLAYDLAARRVVKRVSFPATIAGKTSFLNDLRVNLGHGREGVIYITDASPEGPNGLVVVDIATGQSVRRLDGHPSTRPDPALVLEAEGHKLIQRGGPNIGAPFRAGADGIALSADGKTVYYSPLTSHRLYRVSTAALADGPEAAVRGAVEDLGDKGFAADGLLEDPEGGVLATDLEGGSVRRRAADGTWTVVARGDALSWPDTMTRLPDGALLITATQIHRSPRFRGHDQRKRPFSIVKLEPPRKR